MTRDPHCLAFHNMADAPTLEQRISALESALALPSTASASVGSEVLLAKVETLESAVTKAQYRILQLTKGYEAKAAEVEQLRAQVLTLKH